MVIQINAEIADTIETAATKAANAATVLGVNVLFYWDRQPFEVGPGANPQVLAETIHKVIAEKGEK